MTSRSLVARLAAAACLVWAAVAAIARLRRRPVAARPGDDDGWGLGV